MIDFDPGSEKRAVPPIGAFNLILIAIIIAVIGLVCLIVKVAVGAAVFGAAGLVLGGYCMGYVHKHAGGDRLTVTITREEGRLIVSLANNGETPDAPINETGGLRSLRRMIRREGGPMRVDVRPEFCLTLTLPEGPEETGTE